MGVLSWLARVPAASPYEPFGKDSKISSEGGSTGRRTDWPCRIKIAKKEKLVRPSVQLPAGIHGWRGLYGFWPGWQAKAGLILGMREPSFAALLDTGHPAGVFRRGSGN